MDDFATFLREVFDSSSDCIFVTDVTEDGRFRFGHANPAWERTTGLVAAQVAGRFLDEVIPAANAELVFAQYRRCIQLGAALTYEEKLVMPDRHTWGHVTLKPIRDSAGRIHRLFGVVRDITEVVHAETQNALAGRADSLWRQKGTSSYHFLRFIEDRGDIGLWSSDFATGRVAVAAGWHRILGLPASVLPSYQKLLSMMHPNDLPLHQDMKQIVHSGQPFEREFRIVRPDGTVRWIINRAEAVIGPSGEPIRAIGALIDVTSKHEAQLAIAQNEERYKDAFRALSTVFWTTESDGKPLPSKSWTDFTGQTFAEAADFGWLNAVHPEDRLQTTDCFQTAMHNQAHFQIDCRIRCVDQNYRLFHLRGAPVLGANASIMNWVCIGLPRLSNGAHAADGTIDRDGKPDAGLTDAQIRGARGILAWSVSDLAHASGVSVSTVRRLEEGDAKSVRYSSRLLVRQALEKAGIVFSFSADGKPGIRPR